MALVAAFMND